MKWASIFTAACPTNIFIELEMCYFFLDFLVNCVSKRNVLRFQFSFNKNLFKVKLCRKNSFNESETKHEALLVKLRETRVNIIRLDEIASHHGLEV